MKRFLSLLVFVPVLALAHPHSEEDRLFCQDSNGEFKPCNKKEIILLTGKTQETACQREMRLNRERG